MCIIFSLILILLFLSIDMFLVMHISCYFSCLIFLYLVDTSCPFLIFSLTSNISFYPENGFSSFNKFIFLISFYFIHILIPIACANIFLSVSYSPPSFSYLHFFSFFFFQSSLIFLLLIFVLFLILNLFSVSYSQFCFCFLFINLILFPTHNL